MGTYYRTMKSLPDSTNYTGNCRTGHYTGYPCINDQLGFGWAIEGFLDSKEGDPASLSLERDGHIDDRRACEREQVRRLSLGLGRRCVQLCKRPYCTQLLCEWIERSVAGSRENPDTIRYLLQVRRR